MVATLSSAQPASASASALRLSTDRVVVNGRLAILGSNLTGLLDLYNVTVGGAPAWPDEVDDSSIEFSVPATDRNLQPVALEPKGGVNLPVRLIGEVDVSKAMPPPSGVDYGRGHILVRLAEGADAGSVAADGERLDQLFPESTDARMRRWHRVAVPVGTEAERINAYAGLPEVEVAEYDGIKRPGRQPSDPNYYAEQWNVRKARFTAAWEMQRTGAPIAILDTGVWATHEELSGLVGHNRDFSGTGLVPCGDHGTHVRRWRRRGRATARASSVQPGLRRSARTRCWGDTPTVSEPLRILDPESQQR